MNTIPWYRQRWPWLLMSGPALVLVAGAITTWIAFASADGLVADDYYRQGMAINKVLAREEAARKLGISLELEISPQKLRVTLRGQKPEALFAHLAHATRAGHDERLRLAPGAAPGVYEAELPPLPAGRWRLVIEDPRATWRIVKETS
jgi:uncharacterized protein